MLYIPLEKLGRRLETIALAFGGLQLIRRLRDNHRDIWIQRIQIRRQLQGRRLRATMVGLFFVTGATPAIARM